MLHRNHIGSIVGITSKSIEDFGDIVIGTSASINAENDDLINAGFHFNGKSSFRMSLTIGELFIKNYHLKSKNNLPDEFLPIHPDYTIVTQEKKIDFSEMTQKTKELTKDINSFNCNPKLNNVLKLDENCFSKESNMIGGYQCNKNGIWNTKVCLPAFCTNGRTFNDQKTACI